MGKPKPKVASSKAQALRAQNNFHPDGSPLSGTETIARVRQETDTILLAFSCGKDSIAAWLAVQDHFPRIVPFYMYLIPRLEFVEESLTYFESFFGCHIIRVPHPSLYRMLNALVDQPPERIRLIEAARLPEFDYDQMTDLIVKDQKLPKDTWVANGVRAADSPNRRAAINKYGPINWKRRNFSPVWDLKKDDLLALFEQHQVKLPVDYELFGRSFDGIDHRFLTPLRQHRPKDYQTILDWFPLSFLDTWRYAKQDRPDGYLSPTLYAEVTHA